MEAPRRPGDRSPPRHCTSSLRSILPCTRDRRHTDAHARSAASPPLRTGEPLEAVARGHDGPVRVRGTKRAKGGGDRARLGGHQLGRRESTDEAGEPAEAPGPRRGRCARGAPRTDADFHLLPFGPLRLGVHAFAGPWQGRCRCSAHCCAAWPRRSPTPRAHGRALPGRRHHRVGHRGDDGPDDRARGESPIRWTVMRASSCPSTGEAAGGFRSLITTTSGRVGGRTGRFRSAGRVGGRPPTRSTRSGADTPRPAPSCRRGSTRRTTGCPRADPAGSGRCRRTPAADHPVHAPRST